MPSDQHNPINDVVAMKLHIYRQAVCTYVGVDISPAEQAILDGITQSRGWQARYLRLDRLLLRLERDRLARKQSTPTGQMALFSEAA